MLKIIEQAAVKKFEMPENDGQLQLPKIYAAFMYKIAIETIRLWDDKLEYGRKSRGYDKISRLQYMGLHLFPVRLAHTELYDEKVWEKFEDYELTELIHKFKDEITIYNDENKLLWHNTIVALARFDVYKCDTISPIDMPDIQSGADSMFDTMENPTGNLVLILPDDEPCKEYRIRR